MAYGSGSASYSNSTSSLTSDERSSVGTSADGTIGNRYSDLSLQMIPHPQKRDIIPLKGEMAVKNAIKNLLLTNFFERPFNSTLGANLRGLLFEPADAITKLALENGIRNVLDNHEPRIDNVNVIVQSIQNDTEYRVSVVFNIKATDTVEEVEINLIRLR
tara:strand:- start:687 stop:1166 length:480 start_codon:yes stop_codon:yes gene_type:complete